LQTWVILIVSEQITSNTEALFNHYRINKRNLSKWTKMTFLIWVVVSETHREKHTTAELSLWKETCINLVSYLMQWIIMRHIEMASPDRTTQTVWLRRRDFQSIFSKYHFLILVLFNITSIIMTRCALWSTFLRILV
jgi:hypothetical protein